jgi:flagellar biosynthesis component FlhA
MPFIAVLIGAILIVVGFQGTQSQLAQALETDIPGFFKWGIAVVVILGLGYVPGLTTISRWLLGLVVLVVVLKNYQQMIQGFQNFAQTGQQTAQQAGQSEQQSAQAAAAQATQAENAYAQATGQAGAGNNVQQLAAGILSSPTLAAGILGGAIA